MRRSRSNARRLCVGLSAAVMLLFAACRRQEPVERLEWTAMGTTAAVQTRGAAATRVIKPLQLGVRHRFSEVAAALNAHDPQSELCRLARFPDAEIAARCTAAMRPCYVAAFRLAELSGGAFNPRWRGADTLDLGAIAKGFAVDRAADLYAGEGDGNASLVDLGGNLRSLYGTWETGVKDPLGSSFAARVRLRAGEALATSALYYRGAHIVDGRTGCVVTNGVASVTVLAPSALWADGLSTTLFILGPDDGRAFLDNNLSRLSEGLAASVLWILKDGTQITYGDARFSRD